MQIFISYRRGSTADIAGRMDDHLRKRFGDDGVFRDIQNIPLGSDYREHLADAIGQCDVFIAVIGADYLSERVQQPNDLVRIEIEAALAQQKIVVPVLVGGATMPAPERLPPSLAPLTGRQAAVVGSGRDFDANMRDLIDGIERVRRRRAGGGIGGRLRPVALWAGGVAVALGALLVYRVSSSGPGPGPGPAPGPAPGPSASNVPNPRAKPQPPSLPPPISPDAGGAPEAPGSVTVRDHRTQAPDVRMGATTVQGRMPPEIVQRIVRRHFDEVKSCFEEEVTKKPDLSGRITVKFTIGPSGDVIASVLQNSTLGTPRIQTCLVQAALRWKFPKPAGGGIVVVLYPFVLNPG